MTKQRVTQKDLKTVAKKLVADCERYHSDWATVVALQGDLGAGKTTFTREVAHVLGVKGAITSPTFVIEKIYGLPKKGKSRFSRFVHIDAYRLEGSDELDVLGWHRIVNDPQNLIFIEWPKNVRQCLPDNTLWVTLKHVDETVRDIDW
ncbi:MAG: tRNA (adenosine(37)-N6)-threonylcarbamoyltransferase complex ATPase subunit type 1 TsaE [Candidatus Pacebacteria bacterium]|nr:tRNA (adenosine(37)-N6)-threonylcarbamoyltransferase complex ATPase subunit type 1 TsaE [Candidatus Paceibacterota bacterium]